MTFTLTLLLSQPALFFVDTQYEVFATNTGVVNVLPVNMETPPVAAVYHKKGPFPVAVNVAVLLAQIVTSLAVGTAGVGLTITFTFILLPTQPLGVRMSTQ